jgi:hypothetical protein
MALTEKELHQFLDENNSSMSNYQIDHFVLRSQVTDYRQIKQALLELEGRKDGIRQTNVNLRRKKITKEKLEHDIENSQDEFEKKFSKIDLEEVIKDIEFIERRLKVQQREHDFFAEKIYSRFESKEELEKFCDNPEEEHKYWIARMGKQAAIDMISLGRISVGNMDSIAMMSEEDQIQTLKVAIQYSGLMNVGINKLQQEMIPYLKQVENNSNRLLPTFDGIEDNLNINLVNQLQNEKQKLQLTDKPKIIE